MTVIENLQPRVQYVYSTSSQVYNITFPYIERQYVKCMVKDQELTYNVHYQVPVFDPVSLETDELYLTLLITPTTNLNDGVTIEEGDLITIYRETPIDQQAEFPQTAKFSSQKITEALDKLTLQQQEQQDDISRCLKLAKNVPDDFETSLPSPVGKNYIRWSDDGSQLINYDLEADMNTFKQGVNDAIDDFESDVEDTLSDFQNEINTTKGIANNAVSIANGAVDTADAAEQTAETALSNSQTAINTANTAEGKANSAISTANTADTNASTALTKANQAVSTANTAETNASTALTKANQAITDSATAVSTAEDAVETAESAVETADDALEYATAANTNAASALSNSQTAVSTANTASTNASTALSNSQTAVSTANSASAKVDEFGEDIEQVIEAAEKINELEEAVETAVDAATDATAAATNATTAATNATTAATTATQKAQEATQAAASIVLDTYRVVYGTTTFSQVSTAIQEGKVPLLDMGNNKYGTLINKYTNTTREIGGIIYFDSDFYIFCIPTDIKGKCTYAYLILDEDEGDPDTWVSETLDITEQPNWTQDDSTALDYIKNKPTIPSISNLANQDLSNLTATGEAHFAKIFVAEYNVTTYQQVLDAYNAGKTIVCLNSITNVDYYYKIYQKSSSGFMFASCVNNAIDTILLSETIGWGSINSRPLLQSKYVTHQSIQSTSSSAQGTLLLRDYTSLYQIVRFDTASSITIVFDTSNINFVFNTAYTFELFFNMSMSPVITLSFPNSVTWQGGETPDMSETGTYFFVFRTMDAGTTWLGNLEGRW